MRTFAVLAVLGAGLGLLNSGCSPVSDQPAMPTSFGPNQVVLEVPGMT